MLKKVITRVLKHRHPWRELSFSQLAELYSAISLRQLAQSLVGIFIPVYLYKIGFSLPNVLLFFVIGFTVSFLVSLPVGYLVARIGPKHTLLLSNFTQIVMLLLLITTPSQHWPLALSAIIYGMAYKLYFLSYHVDFSKILHAEHGGKEIGFMFGLGKMAGILAPLAGGVIALFFGARYTLGTGIALFAVSMIPLFASGEPVTRNQKLHFQGLLKRQYYRDYLCFASYSGQQKAGLIIWPLFLATTVFATNTYLQLGWITSIGAIASMLVAIGVGRLVDKKRGGQILKFGAVTMSFVHILRSIVMSLGGIMALSTADQSAGCVNTVSVGRGYYDRANSLPGQRIAYITLMETFSEFGNLAVLIVAYCLSLVLLSDLAFKATFVMAAGISLLMLLQRFPALATRHETDAPKLQLSPRPSA